MSDFGLVDILSHEFDILRLVTSYLDVTSLMSLEASSQDLTHMFDNQQVWYLVLARLCHQRSPKGYNWWERMMVGVPSDKSEYRSLSAKLSGVPEIWETQPTGHFVIQLQERVVDVDLDETGLLVGFKSGLLHLYERPFFNERKPELVVDMRMKRLSKVGLSSGVLLVGDMKSDSFYTPEASTVSVLNRQSGSIIRVISFPGCISVNQVLSGVSEKLIVSHSSFSDITSTFLTSLSIYSKSDLVHYIYKAHITRQSLNPARNSLLLSMSEKVLIINLDLENLTPNNISSNPPDTSSTWSRYQFGFLSNKEMFTIWTNQPDEGKYVLHLTDLENQSLVRTIDLTSHSLEVRFGLTPNLVGQMVGIDKKSGKILLVTDQVKYLDFGFGLDRVENLLNCKEIIADPTSLVCHVRNDGICNIIIIDFYGEQ